MALTIDDLPASAPVAALDLEEARRIGELLLAALAEARAPAVGFVNPVRIVVPGERAAREATLTAWLAAGHELGNHTWSHRSVHAGVPEFCADLLRADSALRPLVEARGGELRWFRHPQLRTGRTPAERAAAERCVASAGYRVAPVTFDNQEWVYALAYRRARAAADSASMARIASGYVAHLAEVAEHHEAASRRLFGRAIPQVLLLHANRLNADHLRDALRVFVDRGYEFVRLEDALADPAFATEERYVGPTGPSWLHRWAGALGVELPPEPREPAWVRAAAGLRE